MMTTKVYYIENSDALTNALNFISHEYPCAIQREFIEMNYSCVELTARTIDIVNIERVLAPLV